MGWKDEIVTIVIMVKLGWFKVSRIEPLGVHHSSRNMLEDQKFLRRQPQVVAI